MNDDMIGMIDSGLGGLTIWKSVKSLLPQESICYLADHAYLPYSGKTSFFIKKRVLLLIKFLLKKNVKIIIIACNTATVAGITYYREAYPQVPIIGVVPVIKTAALMTKKKAFTVLSTEFTAKSKYQKNLIRQFASDCTVDSIGCTDLVERVENGDTESHQITKILIKVLQHVSIKNVDVLVLGCTHFPFLLPRIRAIVGSGVEVIDSAPAVARHIKRVLTQNNAMNRSKNVHYDFVTTGDEVFVSKVASKLLRSHVQFTHAKL